MANEKILETIKKQIEDHEKRISELESLSLKKPEAIEAKPSIRDFTRSKKPKDDLQKTLTIGYYLEKFEGFSSFNAKDLTNGFREAKQPVPQNINDKANKNIVKKYMMEAEKKKDGKLAWVLTAKGEEFVESNFQEKK